MLQGVRKAGEQSRVTDPGDGPGAKPPRALTSAWNAASMRAPVDAAGGKLEHQDDGSSRPADKGSRADTRRPNRAGATEPSEDAPDAVPAPPRDGAGAGNDAMAGADASPRPIAAAQEAPADDSLAGELEKLVEAILRKLGPHVAQQVLQAVRAKLGISATRPDA